MSETEDTFGVSRDRSGTAGQDEHTHREDENFSSKDTNSRDIQSGSQPRLSIAELQSQIEELHQRKQSKEEDLSDAKAKVEELHTKIEASTKELEAHEYERMRVEADVEEITTGAGLSGADALERREALSRLMGPLCEMREAKEWERKFKAECRQRRTDMQAEITKLEEDPSAGDDKAAARMAELRAAIQGQEDRIKHLQPEAAQRSKEVALLRRKIDSMPSRLELVQYERRFVELHEQIQTKLDETRRCYDRYNMLMDANNYTRKEISLLDSIHMQFEGAMATPAGRAKLVESLDAVAIGVDKNVAKVEKRLQQELMSLSHANERYSAQVTAQRRYFALVKDFQEECARAEALRIQVEQYGKSMGEQ